jgi:hypothetical protein
MISSWAQRIQPEFPHARGASMFSEPYKLPLVSALLLLLLTGTVRCANSSDDGAGRRTCLPIDPCFHPWPAVIVSFKRGTTEAQIDETIRSVGGYNRNPPVDMDVRFLVPGDECAALERLRQSPHVVAASQDILLHLMDPDSGQCAS